MGITSQERLALGVVTLLLAVGAGVRWVRPAPPPVEWSAAAHDSMGARLAAKVEGELAREARRATPLAPGERIDVNRADAAELDRLPKVGPALAARMVARRSERGPFRTLADLDSVPGVGAALLAAVSPHVDLPAAPPRSAASAPARGEPRGGAPTAAGPLDLNTASAGELEALPRVGPVLARRIVEHRGRRGRFGSLEELREVPGIGEATLRHLAPRVRLSP